jgi:hypothetical protein
MRERAAWILVVAIAAVGLLRFALDIFGAPANVTKVASMTAVMLAGCIYFGLRARSYRELWKFAYVLILPYMLIELAAIGYAWASGLPSIFHTPEYSFNSPIHIHFWGHLIGGLTWEPLALFVLMAAIRAISRSLIHRGIGKS